MANKTVAQRIAEAQAKTQQEQNNLKQLQAKQKEQDRKARNHRLCKRHGLIESLLPDIATLTDEQFQQFLKEHIANNHGKKKLEHIVEQGKKNQQSEIVESGEQPTNPNPEKSTDTTEQSTVATEQSNKSTQAKSEGVESKGSGSVPAEAQPKSEVIQNANGRTDTAKTGKH